MNIIELAEQAGLAYKTPNGKYWIDAGYPDIHLERFAELVRQDEREKCSEDYLDDCVAAVEAARLEEREACAKLLENTDLTNAGQYIGLVSGIILGYVKAIRARGDK